VKKDLSKDDLKQAFRHFDPENKGKITPDGLKAVLQKQGKQLTKAELKELINEVDREEQKQMLTPR
jgi:Ca2+-binding EF-hand superfamily protein